VERYPSWPKGADCKSAGSAFTGSNPVLSTRYGPLAQLVEHLTFNQGVPGSSPGWLTRQKHCKGGNLRFLPLLHFGIIFNTF
jgi:hypothetical protein